TGKPESMIDSAKIARKTGARVIAVTTPDSPLSEHCDILLPLSVPDEQRFFYMPSRGRYGQLYILDCLATTLGARRANHAGQMLLRVRGMLIDLHGETSGQPIGD